MENSNAIDGRYTTAAPVLLAFANLIEPKAVGKKGKAKGEPKYSVTAGISMDGPDAKGIIAKAKAVAEARWPGRDLKELKMPFESAAKRVDREKRKAEKEGKKPYDNSFLDGMMVLTARSKYRPQLASVENGQVVDYTDDTLAVAKQKFYRGAMVLLKLNFQTYEGQKDEDTGQGNPDGINVYVDQVLKVKEGKRLGGSAPAADTFKSYLGAMTAEDPTDNLDAEISF